MVEKDIWRYLSAVGNSRRQLEESDILTCCMFVSGGSRASDDVHIDPGDAAKNSKQILSMTEASNNSLQIEQPHISHGTRNA